MKRYVSISVILLTLAILILNCGEKQIKLKRAEMDYVQNQLEKFAPVKIGYNKSLLTEKQQQIVEKLVHAADYMDRIFLTQVYSENLAIKKALQRSDDPDDEVYLDYFNIMYGPFDRLNENKPFLIEKEKPEGAHYYPEDMTKAEFEAWLSDHPEDKKSFENNFTLIRRDGEKLVAIPYSEAYADQLNSAAKLLREAADLAENQSLKKFLNSRADAFLSNDYYQSDIDWVRLDSEIEVVIGPYEVYEDGLFGYKAAFESFICVVDPDESKKLSVIANYLDKMEQHLPYKDEYKNFERGSASPIKVVQEIYTAGDTRAGFQTLAFNLPNDERVREQEGSKKVMLKNVMEAKFNKILKPIADRVIDNDQLSAVTFDAYFNHILLHEVSHGLGPGTITLPSGEKTTVNKMLSDTYSVIEETKADICGNYNVQYLIDLGVLPKKLESSLYVTFLSGMFRSVRFGHESAHGKANMIQFNYLTANDAFVYDSETGRFSVDHFKVKDAVKNLAHLVLTIEAKGDYQAAENLIKNYGVMTETMRAALDNLDEIPVDIKPIYAVTQN